MSFTKIVNSGSYCPAKYYTNTILAKKALCFTDSREIENGLKMNCAVLVFANAEPVDKLKRIRPIFVLYEIYKACHNS